ncbi:cation h+ exchanger [Lasius niger]|uniref:Cation h+ exchanger n=1 Tax=Lasius niger TaxID=67767 RepID=A0A0J7K6N3_LASNI|nr:cation h+ exchanger [Lasius niger]
MSGYNLTLKLMVSANQTNMIPAEVTTKEVVEIPKALPAPKEPKVREEQMVLEEASARSFGEGARGSGGPERGTQPGDG